MKSTAPELKIPEIIFDEEKHTYTVDGELYTGVTTIMNVRSKDFLKFWSAKMAVKAFGYYDKYNWNTKRAVPKKEQEEGLANMILIKDSLAKMNPIEYYNFLVAAKNSHTVFLKGAQDLGTEFHAWAENRIKTDDKTLPKEEKLKAMCKAFLAWEKTHDVIWLESELMLASRIHKFAGTLDALAIVDGKLTIVDFKTSSQMSEDHSLQTGGYQILLEECGLQGIEQRLIVRVPKAPEEGKKIIKVEEKIINTDVEFDKEAFLCLRTIHRWNLHAKKKK